VDFRHGATAAPLLTSDKGTTVRQGVSEAGAIFPSACTRSGAVFCPHPLCPPLPQAGEGERAAGRTAVRPYTPLPRCGRGAGGEGEKACAPRTQ
jgi:hypothetical protein